MLLNISILHEATVYLISRTQLLGNTMLLGKTGYETFRILTTRNNYQRSTKYTGELLKKHTHVYFRDIEA